GRRKALDALLGEPRPSVLDPIPETLPDELVEEGLLCVRVVAKLEELTLRHDPRVETHVRHLLLERRRLLVCAQPKLLAGERGEVRAVLLPSDGHDHLPRHIAAENDDACTVELPCVDELLEAHIRA